MFMNQRARDCQEGNSTKLIYLFNIAPLKIPADSFAEVEKLVQNFMWECKGPRVAQEIWKEQYSNIYVSYPTLKLIINLQ